MVTRKSLVVIMLVFVCLVSAFIVARFDDEGWKSSAALAATDYPANSIWIDPSIVNITDAQVGQTFRVVVWVQNASDMVAWQVHMEFNDSIINATQWIEPTTDSHYIFAGKTTNALLAPPDASYVHLLSGKGRVQVAALLATSPPLPAPQEPSNGTGMLCTIEFKVTQVPPKDGQLSCLLDINSTDTYMLAPPASNETEIQEIQNVTKYNATVYLELGTEPTGSLGLDWWAWAIIAVIVIVVVVGVVLIWRRRK